MITCSAPATALRDLVRYYYQVESRLASGAALQPVPARSPEAIEFMFGTPYEVHRLDRGGVENAHPVALIGVQTFRRVELVMRGHVDAFTIVFQPGGVFRLFGVPGEVLTNDHFDGEATLGRGLGELLQRLGAKTSFADRIAVADDYLRARATRLAPASSVALAAMHVLANGGRGPLSVLAHGTGLGLRQFERLFRLQIGMPPKLYARIVRFEAALRRKAASPALRWTDVAHVLGYHDQMHMVHDFNQLSGGSPTAIGRQLDMFVQPEVVSWRPRNESWP